MEPLARMSATALLIAVFTSAALASCSRADADSPQATPASQEAELAALLKAEQEGDEQHPAACSFISADEMGRILGGAVVSPKGDRPSTCTYTPASGKGGIPYTQIKIDWKGGDAAMSGVKLAERLIGRNAGMSIASNVEGVGDEATMLIGNVMTVRKGATVITIDLRLQPNAKEKGVAIAKTLIERAHIGEASK